MLFWIQVDAAEVLTGTYVGNGVDNRQITGLGFQPDRRDHQGESEPTGSRAHVHDDR